MNKRSRLPEIGVGLFVVAALALLVIGSLWIAGGAFWRGERASYRVLMQDSGGIEAGDRVRFYGVKVGRVEEVTLQPDPDWPVVFHVTLDPAIGIKTDSTARISSTGLLSDNYLEIKGGSPGAPALQAGGEIRGESRFGLDDTLARVDEISESVLELTQRTATILDQLSTDLGPILTSVQQLLSPDGEGSLRQVLASTQRTLEQSGPRVVSLLERLDSISARFDEGMEDVPELTRQLSHLAGDVRAAIGPDGSRLQGLLEAGETSLASAGETLSLIGDNRAEIEAVLIDLTETLANLKAFSQQVKERPFSLVRVKPAPDRRPGDGVEDGAR